MTTTGEINDLATRLATEFKSIRTLIGGTGTSTVSGLTTEATNLVAAINEVLEIAESAAGGGISEGEVETIVSTAINALLDGAPSGLNTLNELAAALGDDASYASTITSALGSKADDSVVVKLSGNQTIGGTKTFSSAPSVPDSSFSIAKTTGLQTALDGKIASFADPNADRLVFWDDSAGAYVALTPGTGLSITTTTMNVATASESAAGIVELATTTEAGAGTDTARAVTPAGLRAVLGDQTTDFVATFEAALA